MRRLTAWFFSLLKIVYKLSISLLPCQPCLFTLNSSLIWRSLARFPVWHLNVRTKTQTGLKPVFFYRPVRSLSLWKSAEVFLNPAVWTDRDNRSRREPQTSLSSKTLSSSSWRILRSSQVRDLILPEHSESVKLTLSTEENRFPSSGSLNLSRTGETHSSHFCLGFCTSGHDPDLRVRTQMDRRIGSFSFQLSWPEQHSHYCRQGDLSDYLLLHFIAHE